MANNPYEFNEFYCVLCGNRGIPIVRKRNAAREAGHLKKLFCLTCGKETNHAECKPNSKYQYSDFLIEFNCHNFTPEGLRIKPYSELKEAIKNEKTLVTCGNSGNRKKYLDQES